MYITKVHYKVTLPMNITKISYKDKLQRYITKVHYKFTKLRYALCNFTPLNLSLKTFNTNFSFEIYVIVNSGCV
jgi:hypothetical protein